MKSIKKINTLIGILLFLSLLGLKESRASHLDGAEIYHECIGTGKYIVTVELYRDCNSSYFTFPIINLSGRCNNPGGGNSNITLPIVDTIDATPMCTANLSSSWCNGGGFNGTTLYIYRDTVQFDESLCANFRFIHWECCRNDAITNINSASTVEQLVYTEIDQTKAFCNSSPRMESGQVAVAQVGQPFVYDPQLSDPDGDSLVVSVAQPISSGLFFMPGNYIYGPTQPLPAAAGLTVDPHTGLTTYTPTGTSYNVIAYKIEEYRNGLLIGTSQKEIAVYHIPWFNSGNSIPSYDINNTTSVSVSNDSFQVCSGTNISFDIVVSDSNTTDSLVLETHYLTDVLPGATVTSSGTNPRTYTVNWTAVPGIYRPQLIMKDIDCPYAMSGQLIELYFSVFNSNPTIAISDQYLCSSSPITLSTSGNYGSYNWSTGETTSSISVNTAGVYSLSVSGGNCGGGSTSVEIFDTPFFSVGNDTTITEDDSLQLEATLGNGLKLHYEFRKDSALVVSKMTFEVLPLMVNGVFPSVLSEQVMRKAYFDIRGDNMRNLEIFLVPPNGILMPLVRNQGWYSSSMTNIGFSPAATDLITNYTTQAIPADSTFVPDGSWATLNGSPTNGKWHLLVNYELNQDNPDTLNYFGLDLGLYEFSWTPSAGLSCTDCANPVAAPDSTTTYIVSMTGSNGCVSYDTITITVAPPPNAPTDTLSYVVAEDSSITNICATIPSFMTGAASSTILCGATAGTLTANGLTCFDYLATASPQVSDTICMEVCDSTGLCDTTVFVITTASCVWAGDTDTNQVVNNFDILPIGLGAGQTGIIRPNADLNFDCEPNLDWTNSTPITQVNYKHSDTDGDGTVTPLDTVAIVQNWGQFYVKSGGISSSSTQSPKPFYVDYKQTVPSATIQVPIILGDTTNPVDSAYGVAFSINYDAQYIDTNSVSVSFDSSWLGDINTNMIAISKDFYNQGRIDVGLTRIDQTYQNGLGRIGTVQLTIKDDILKTAFQHVNMQISNVRLITDQEIEIPTNNVPTYILVELPTSVAELPSKQPRVYPNPTSNTVHIESVETMEMIRVYNMAGQVLESHQAAGTAKQLSFQNLPAGMYILSIQTNNGQYQQRITILR